MCKNNNPNNANGGEVPNGKVPKNDDGGYEGNYLTTIHETGKAFFRGLFVLNAGGISVNSAFIGAFLAKRPNALCEGSTRCSCELPASCFLLPHPIWALSWFSLGAFFVVGACGFNIKVWAREREREHLKAKGDKKDEEQEQERKRVYWSAWRDWSVGLSLACFFLGCVAVVLGLMELLK